MFWSNIVPETKAENMWVKVPETGLGHNFWWFISLFWAIGVITVIIFPYRLWKPTKKDIFEKRKGSLHGLLQSYLVMCDLKTSPTCLNHHHLTRREGTLPNKKVSHKSESYIMWYFGVTTQRTLATMGSDESVFWANAKSAFEWQGDSSWVSSSCYVPSALCLSTWC